MLQIFIEGFALGLTTGGYCFTACMPFLFPLILSEGKQKASQNFMTVLNFALGRLIAYLIVGSAAGWLGGHILHGTTAKKILSAVVILSSAVLIAYGFSKDAPQFRICRYITGSSGFNKVPLILGFLLGINICPPFLIALSLILERGAAVIGAVFFFAFFLGTSIFLVPVVFLSFLSKIEKTKTIGRIAAVFVGVWFLITGVRSLLG